jgi:hypothetical protein
VLPQFIVGFEEVDAENSHAAQDLKSPRPPGPDWSAMEVLTRASGLCSANRIRRSVFPCPETLKQSVGGQRQRERQRTAPGSASSPKTAGHES